MHAAIVAILALSSFIWLLLLAGRIVDTHEDETDRFARYIRLHYREEKDD